MISRVNKRIMLNRALSFNRKYSETSGHIPVMLNECLKNLNPLDGEVIIDMTFGAGGHTKKILDKANCTVIALDRDPVAHEKAKLLSTSYPGRLIPLLGRFSELPELLKDLKYGKNSIDGMLFDFGCSSMQMDSEHRGFSVSKDSLLDMRMDANRFPQQLTAREVLAIASEYELTKIFKIYGDEKKAAKIARTIVDARYMLKKIETTKELSDIVDSVCGDEIRYDKLHRYTSNATKVFQALRIFVNNELNEINYAMLLSKYYLKLNGRLVTLSFHSLEDTIVKRHISGHLINDVANPVPLKYISPGLVQDQQSMEEFLDSCWQPLSKHVEVPTDAELSSNPRCRSARLRAAIKIK